MTVVITETLRPGCIQRSSIAAVGELTNCLPGTEAKLMNKS